VHHGQVPVDPAPHPVSAVPLRMRIVCACTAVALVAFMTVVAVLLKSSTTGVVAFRTSDQIAMAGLGVVLGAVIVWLSRPRVDGDATGIRVRNIVGSYQLPWSVVRSVRFDRHSPWASLLLTNGEEVAVLALQAADQERALRAVEGLRALLAAATPAPDPATRTPLLYE
jgi:PH (Pleckstrin Homology) domain-containing protein